MVFGGEKLTLMFLNVLEIMDNTVQIKIWAVNLAVRIVLSHVFRHVSSLAVFECSCISIAGQKAASNLIGRGSFTIFTHFSLCR